MLQITIHMGVLFELRIVTNQTISKIRIISIPCLSILNLGHQHLQQLLQISNKGPPKRIGTSDGNWNAMALAGHSLAGRDIVYWFVKRWINQQLGILSRQIDPTSLSHPPPTWTICGEIEISRCDLTDKNLTLYGKNVWEWSVAAMLFFPPWPNPLAESTRACFRINELPIVCGDAVKLSFWRLSLLAIEALNSLKFLNGMNLKWLKWNKLWIINVTYILWVRFRTSLKLDVPT